MELRVEAIGRRASGKTWFIAKLIQFLEKEGWIIPVGSFSDDGHKFVAWRKDANDK